MQDVQDVQSVQNVESVQGVQSVGLESTVLKKMWLDFFESLAVSILSVVPIMI